MQKSDADYLWENLKEVLEQTAGNTNATSKVPLMRIAKVGHSIRATYELGGTAFCFAKVEFVEVHREFEDEDGDMHEEVSVDVNVMLKAYPAGYMPHELHEKLKRTSYAPMLGVMNNIWACVNHETGEGYHSTAMWNNNLDKEYPEVYLGVAGGKQYMLQLDSDWTTIKF